MSDLSDVVVDASGDPDLTAPAALAGLPRWVLDGRAVMARAAARPDGAYSTVGLLICTLTHLLVAGRVHADAYLADAAAEHAEALVEDVQRSGEPLAPPDPDVLLNEWPSRGAPDEPPYAALLHVCCASLCGLLSDAEADAPLWLVALDVRDAGVALRAYARAVRGAAP